MSKGVTGSTFTTLLPIPDLLSWAASTQLCAAFLGCYLTALAHRPVGSLQCNLGFIPIAPPNGLWGPPGRDFDATCLASAALSNHEVRVPNSFAPALFMNLMPEHCGRRFQVQPPT